jgi:uncharacterized membrane protein
MALDDPQASTGLAAATAPNLLSRFLPAEGEEGPTVAAVLPWLGVPVLVSAALSRIGRPLPGEVLPVVAFLPAVALAFAAAMWLPVRLRVALVGLPGLALLAALLAFLGQGSGPGAARTFWAAAAAAALCALAFWLVARALRPGLAVAGTAMVLAQGLDGLLTYLAVANPFEWLPEASTERVVVSRLLLDKVPLAYPALKLALPSALALGLDRWPMSPHLRVWVVLVVCYAGLSPAMFSAAHLLAS